MDYHLTTEQESELDTEAVNFIREVIKENHLADMEMTVEEAIESRVEGMVTCKCDCTIPCSGAAQIAAEKHLLGTVMKNAAIREISRVNSLGGTVEIDGLSATVKGDRIPLSTRNAFESRIGRILIRNSVYTDEEKSAMKVLCDMLKTGKITQQQLKEMK
jgi:hypothetical protein